MRDPDLLLNRYCGRPSVESLGMAKDFYGEPHVMICFDDNTISTMPTHDWNKSESDFFRTIDNIALALVGLAASYMWDAGLNFSSPEGHQLYRRSLSRVIKEWYLLPSEVRILIGTGRLSRGG